MGQIMSRVEMANCWPMGHVSSFLGLGKQYNVRFMRTGRKDSSMGFVCVCEVCLCVFIVRFGVSVCLSCSLYLLVLRVYKVWRKLGVGKSV